MRLRSLFLAKGIQGEKCVGPLKEEDWAQCKEKFGKLLAARAQDDMTDFDDYLGGEPLGLAPQ